MLEKAEKEIELLLERYPDLSSMRGALTDSVAQLSSCFQEGGKLLVCGNGGSAADSLHIAGELMKGFVLERTLPQQFREELRATCPQWSGYYAEHLQGALPVISLVNETGLMTAYSNDKAPDLVFAQQVLGYGRPGDILLAISTSGNSRNVVHAARIAKTMGLKVISLTGKGGGALAELSDILLAVPSEVTYQIQEYHLPVYHALCLAVEQEMFGE